MPSDEKHFDFVRDLPCFMCSAPPRSEVSHLRAKTDGGTALKPSPWFVLPLCHDCHALSHKGEVSFFGGIENVYKAKELATLLYDESGNKRKALGIMFRYKRKMMA